MGGRKLSEWFTGWKTWLEHGVACLAFQALVGWMVGNYLWPAVVAVAFFMGREVAQVEDKGRSELVKCADGKYLRCHVNTLNSLGFGYAFLNPRKWSFDSIMDLVVPVVMCIPLVVLV